MFVGVEARGFMFGPPIALAIGAKFVPLRKPRKLPGMFNKVDDYGQSVSFQTLEPLLN